MNRRFFLAGGAMAAASLAAPANAEPAQQHHFFIYNQANRPIFVAIPGHRPDVLSRPPLGGKMPTNNHYEDDLFEGGRVVVVWDQTGKFLKATNLSIQMGGSIVIQADGTAVLVN